ncbi:contractile injection system protein, VgrG/Pvc8 family [Lysobacter changpingensis]|uniref:contractile injection system protein, VgrG/Pvc8 family n=1 Tax=Lysobacter changpingensis TaxID=2792784 RepID=UPI001A8C4B2E
MAHRSDVRFKFEAAGRAFDVVRFELSEGISQPFRLELDLSGFDDTVDAAALLDTQARFTIERDGVVHRAVFGLVCAFEQGGTGFHRTRYRAVVESPLARLGLRHNSRIFQRIAAPGILETLLKEHRLVARSVYGGNHELREYCTQYRQSDATFFHQLATEEGIVQPQPALEHSSGLPHSGVSASLGEAGGNATQFEPRRAQPHHCCAQFPPFAAALVQLLGLDLRVPGFQRREQRTQAHFRHRAAQAGPQCVGEAPRRGAIDARGGAPAERAPPLFKPELLRQTAEARSQDRRQSPVRQRVRQRGSPRTQESVAEHVDEQCALADPNRSHADMHAVRDFIHQRVRLVEDVAKRLGHFTGPVLGHVRDEVPLRQDLPDLVLGVLLVRRDTAPEQVLQRGHGLIRPVVQQLAARRRAVHADQRLAHLAFERDAVAHVGAVVDVARLHQLRAPAPHSVIERAKLLHGVGRVHDALAPIEERRPCLVVQFGLVAFLPAFRSNAIDFRLSPAFHLGRVPEALDVAAGHQHRLRVAGAVRSLIEGRRDVVEILGEGQFGLLGSLPPGTKAPHLVSIRFMT